MKIFWKRGEKRKKTETRKLLASMHRIVRISEKR